MRVLWHYRNRIRVEVALEHEFQVALGFQYTYRGETFPWTLTFYFICFRIVLCGSLDKEMKSRRALYDNEGDDEFREAEWR